MKGDTFILKRVYLERNAEREYLQHVKRLEKIKTQPTNLHKKVNQIDFQVQKNNEYHIKAKIFHEQEKIREEKMTNKVMISKLLQIDRGNSKSNTEQMRQSQVMPHIDQKGSQEGQSQQQQQQQLDNSKDQDPQQAQGQNIQQQEIQLDKSLQSVGSSKKQLLINQSSKQLSQKQQYSQMRSINRGSPMAQSLNYIARKIEDERVAMENQALAERMFRLPPVIQKKKQDVDYNKAKELGDRIKRFHVLKKKKDPSMQSGPRTFDYTLYDDEIDERNEALMNQRIQVVVMLKLINFINFLPQNCEEEKYFLEVKASIRQLRRTTPELYNDFAKSVINEFLYLRELKKNKMIYVGLWQIKEGKERFLGDFELDLEPYYKEDLNNEIHFDLRNYKELYLLPNYMPKDMRKKGNIDFTLKVKSSIKQYLLDNPPQKYKEGEKSTQDNKPVQQINNEDKKESEQANAGTNTDNPDANNNNGQ